MARKRTYTKKYIPKNEFRKNNSPSAIGHPAYIFGETKTKYKSFGLTSNPDDKERKIELRKNPDSKSTDKSYIRVKPVTENKKYYSQSILDWSFSKDDMSVVRHLKKDYKKRAYRKPKKKKK